MVSPRAISAGTVANISSVIRGCLIAAPSSCCSVHLLRLIAGCFGFFTLIQCLAICPHRENQRLVVEDIAGDAVSRPVECECDRTLAVVATTASRATITNPVILRCLVMGTPPSSKKKWHTCTNNKCALSEIERQWARPVRRISEGSGWIGFIEIFSKRTNIPVPSRRAPTLLCPKSTALQFDLQEP